MIQSINDFKKPFFIGVAGTGMSAIAQYLQGIGKEVSGSDRYFHPGEFNDTKSKLEAEGIQCFLQNGEGITNETDLVVVSTAIEDTVAEVIKAKQMNKPIIKRAELLAIIAKSKKTIAVGGTSGKSTTSAMIFDILQYAKLEPSIISGAGLTSIIREGKIGNAKVGKGDWLVIEADESDGSIVNYHPEIGLLLNIDKDHKEIEVLLDVFAQFRDHTKEHFVVNQSHPLARQLSVNPAFNFSVDETDTAAYHATAFSQKGLSISFSIRSANEEASFQMNAIGKHNMENALAAVTVSHLAGVSLRDCATALQSYEGIYRRHQVIGQKNGVWLIDDYAHNPAKCAASIEACQPLAKKVIAWFQPHGYGPTKFLRHDFVDEIARVLRPQDEIWMSEIFYAGGTAVKDISANDLIEDLKAKGVNAFFTENRNDFPLVVRPHFTNDCVLLLMGARDPGLEGYAKFVWEHL
ncbi:MAG: Mur ligase domain-containing protein [Chitinophagaceae bacterium]